MELISEIWNENVICSIQSLLKRWKSSPVDGLRRQVADYDSQYVPEVPLIQLSEYVHLPQAHLPADQPCQWHSCPEHHWGLSKCCCGLQLLFQTRTLTNKHLGPLLAQSMHQLQSRCQGEIGCGFLERSFIQICRGCDKRWHVFWLACSHSWRGILFCRGQTLRGHGTAKFNRKDGARGSTFTKNLINFRMAVALTTSMCSVRQVFVWLRAPFFKCRKSVLTLQTGTSYCFCQVWGFTVSSGDTEQQLLEWAVMVNQGVLGFIKGQGTEATVFRLGPVPGLGGS